jgi:acyl carrier protein
LTRPQILQKLTEIVQDELDEDSLSLTEQMRASDVGGWDSVAHVRIVVGVEQAFNVRFSTERITKLKKVGDLVDLIQQSLT